MKSDKQKYLSKRQHTLLRPSALLGDITTKLFDGWIIENNELKYTNYLYNEGFFKLIFEPIDNAIDEYIRTNKMFGKKLIIKTEYNTDTNNIDFYIKDTGRGLSTELMRRVDEDGNEYGDNLPSSLLAFTDLMVGSSFISDRETRGTFGMGVSLTNLFSKEFYVKTVNNKECFEMTCTDNITNINYTLNRKNRSKDKRGTYIKFSIDIDRFTDSCMIPIHIINGIIQMRMIEVKTFYPDMRIKFNGNEIQYGLSSYLRSELLVTENNIFSLGFSNDKKTNLTYINGVYTYDGGDHLKHIQEHIYNVFYDFILKKYKVEIKKSQLFKYFYVVFGMSKIKDPKYIGQYKSSFSMKKELFDKYIEPDVKVINSYLTNIFKDNQGYFELIVNDILDKKEETLIKKQKRDSKKNKVAIDKYFPLSPNKRGVGDLFILEGDSAMGIGIKVRDKKRQALYSLGGKMLNVFNKRESIVRSSKKALDLIDVLGCEIDDKKYMKNIRFKNVYLMPDGDVDGYHIALLVIVFFYKYFPDYIKAGKLRKLRIPLFIARKSNDKKIYYSFKSYEEDEQYLADNNYKVKYYKGIGSFNDEEYQDFLNSLVYDTIDLGDDVNFISKIFSDDTDFRKKWLSEV